MSVSVHFIEGEFRFVSIKKSGISMIIPDVESLENIRRIVQGNLTETVTLLDDHLIAFEKGEAVLESALFSLEIGKWFHNNDIFVAIDRLVENGESSSCKI